MLDVGVVDVFSAGVVHLKNSVAGTSFMCATGRVCLQSARVGVTIVSVFGPTDSFYYWCGINWMDFAALILFLFLCKNETTKEIVGEIRPFVFKVHTQSLILTSTHTDLHKPINTHTNAHTAQWFREHIVLSIKSRLETFLGLRHENYSRSSCYVHVVYFCVCVCYIKSWHRLSVSRDEQSVCIWHWQLFLTVDIPPTVRHLFL